MDTLAFPDPLIDDPQRLQALRRYAVLDTPMEPAYDELADMAGHICAAPVALISFLDRERQWFKAAMGLAVQETPLDQSICRYAARQTGVFVVPDLALDPRFAHFDIVTQEHPMRFYAGAPLVTPDGYVLGTLCVLDYVPRLLAPRLQELMLALARQVIRLLELKRANERQGHMLVELEEARRQMAVLAHTDVLTGLSNRRAFTERLRQELALLQRGGEPASLLMLDVDHFKRVNDLHGHHAGDMALQHVAALCREVFRAADVVSRWGGEEFMALLPATGVDQAGAVAERLHAALAARPVPGIEPALVLTASMGLSAFEPLHPLDITLRTLDAAMYTAKREGRNRTVAV
ncbi:sensor domain-containing diguanylate cyclase [Acidovorax sp. sic0104]|uniref:GGDEF domain-containing protein n=1 Tax=Acidovorax sp. sic0104 TaxID=2854784 RepID=UPI001C440608|nr:sensor domain-containing diguanylate cyclase [Acidovorax sp. sic0104]MBV7544326.1 sensor domain-containing diguanylate cyclase [Acidovorax sp. sic0104]